MNSPGDQIRKEIAECGAIPFARFMELALYCPLCGYYEKKRDTAGTGGDFYTSVSVGPLLGELLAFQFDKWLSALVPLPSTLHLVEAGAHDGRLAKDILLWLRSRRPSLFERIEYLILEPSARRQAWQRETLTEFASRVRWFADFDSLAASPPGTASNPHSPIANPQSVCGVVFSNELLDAMPVQRFGWDAKRRAWFEWGVTLHGDKLVACRLAECASAPLKLPVGLLDVLPDGFTTEICRAAETWWRQAASVLKHGRLLTLDYGITAEEFFAPQRANGTLRAYQHHRPAADVLADPGELDLTAHVNFTAIQHAGESVGLKTESFEPQSKFLAGIAQQAWQPDSNFGPWTREHTRQFQTLTHPDHLGRSFRVLIQSRGGG